jgi:3-methyladenine DNA glycosylase/8-oxoguanine DNA glycosylase
VDGLRRTITMPEPIQPFAVLGHLRRGSGDPTMKLWAGGCLRASRTPDGPATLHLAFDGTATAVARAWGQGAAWAIEHAPDLLGAADHGAAEFQPADPYVRRLLRDAGGSGAVRVGRSHAVCEALVPTILEQRVTGGGARRSYRWLVRRFGEPAPGTMAGTGPHTRDRLLLPPHPEVLAAQPSWVFHRAGVERSRAETIKRTMQRAPRIEEAAAMSMTGAHTRLRAFPGVGAWTANEVALVALGDADAVSVGDYHLKNIVAYALAGEPRASDERMVELLEPWRGDRARVVRLLERSGPGAPRYGPKVETPEIASL